MKHRYYVRILLRSWFTGPNLIEIERENQPIPSIQMHMGVQLKIIWILFVWVFFQ